jgi:hypothetical protein
MEVSITQESFKKFTVRAMGYGMAVLAGSLVVKYIYHLPKIADDSFTVGFMVGMLPMISLICGVAYHLGKKESKK